MKPRAWRLAIIGALLLFLFFGDAPARTRFWSAFFDAGHAPLFGIVALVIHGWLAARRAGGRSSAPGVFSRGAGASPPPVSVLLAAFAITVIVGAATEVLQTFQARGDPSLVDLLRDTAGAGAFLLAARSVSSRGARRLGLVAVALSLLLAAGWTLLVTSARYVARDRAYPTLFALDGSWWEADFVELGASTLTPGARQGPGTAGQARLARLDLQPGLYPGITFDEPFPDWRGRDCLTLTVVSDLDGPLVLVIRVHDERHDQRLRDRFNRRLEILPGVNRIRIPLEEIRTAPDRRRMDMARIRGVVLFAYDLKRPAQIFLGPLRLE